jgi:exonuclease III
MWFLWILLAVGASGAPQNSVDRDLSVVSWNINGVRKFGHLPSEVAFLANQDIVLLQETFAREDSELLEIRGFYSHHSRALPRPGGRNVWGLSSYFKTSTFAAGFWVKIFVPADWILVSRWKTENSAGLMVVNAYIPAHTSGFAAHDVATLRETIGDLLTNFPGDVFVIGGDFNLDRFRDDVSNAMAK